MRRRHLIALTVLLCTAALPSAEAQIKIKADTLACPIVGFHVGTVIPWGSMSHATDLNGNEVAHATMADLYKAPWLDFGIDVSYKWRNGLFANADFTFMFGNDNLQNRTERMSDIYTQNGIIIGSNGTDAIVTAHNRALAWKAGIGKIFLVNMEKNPNSGPFAALNVGVMQQQTIFTLNDFVDAPQVNNDYGLLYDHQRNSFMLSQEIGYWHISNSAAILNFRISVELTEVWSRSTRDYIIDDLLGLRGKDNNKYFDLLGGIKLTWMFPITGRTSYDYYYY